MRYLKTFESYSEAPVDVDVTMDPAKEKVINDAIAKLSPEEKENAFAALEELAKKLGCSVEQLTDTEFVQRELGEAGAQMKVEEGFFSNLSSGAKRIVGGILKAVGVVGGWATGLASAVTAVLGIAAGAPDCRVDWMWNEALRSLSQGEQAAMTMAGLAGIVISVLAANYIHQKGANLQRDADRMEGKLRR